MLGSWYKPSEIGKRAMIFWLAGSIGQLFSGFLQAAAYTNLNGVYGRAGWRWLFIIDGIITFPLAVAGYFFFPNLPHSGIKTWYITEKEQEISVQRMKSIGRAGKAPWTKAKVKALLTSWHTYFLRKMSSFTPILGDILNTSSSIICCMEQWISAAGYGLLVEELQQKTPTSAWNSLLCRANQQLSVRSSLGS